MNPKTKAMPASAAAQRRLDILQGKTETPKHNSVASTKYNCTATNAEISRTIHNSFQYFNRPLVKTDEECAKRLNSYFKDCHDQGMIPTLECMALSLGTTTGTIRNWENGKGVSADRSYMIKKAKQILAAIDAEMAAEGKIPQVVYIFRSKNFYGMTDQQEISFSTSLDRDLELSADDIAKKYLPDGNQIETNFVDGADQAGI